MANISRNFSNIKATMDQDEMIERFDNMIEKVCNMIEKQGPIYSVWIRFQIGQNNPITFNTSSTDLKENLIAELSMEKQGAGIGNSFNLRINYDPFNHGQNTKDKIELLDALIADFASYDFIMDNELFDAKLRGYIQYGYNYTEDTNMVSPKYEFLLSKASSVIDWSSGMTVYTFEGVSYLTPKCNLLCNFDAIGQDGSSLWKLTDLVRWILYYYYGDPDNPPEPYISKGTDCANTEERYLIDVPKELQEDSPEIEYKAVTDKNPFEYCEMVMNGRMAKSDEEKYKNKELTDAQKPKYMLSITDQAGKKTIHMSYINPNNGENNKRLKFQFSWNQKTKNIVQQWEPEVNLYYFLIKQASLNYQKRDLDRILTSDAGEEEKINAQKKFDDQVDSLSNQAYELYNSTLTTVGIPGDLPPCVEIDIIPKITESVSRTQGVYSTIAISDRISTKGLYTSTFKLFRLRNIGETVNLKDKEQSSIPSIEERKAYLESLDKSQAGRRRRWRRKIK